MSIDRSRPSQVPQLSTMADAEQADRKRKRPRAARACDLCRTKKYRCDESEPCSHCRKQNLPCRYQGAERVRNVMNMSSYVTELEERVQSLTTKNAELMSRSEPHSQHTQPAKQSSSVGVAFMSPASTDNTVPPLPDPRSTSQSAGNAVEETASIESGDDPESEVNDVNPHTRNHEFHGPTSSMAFLAAIQPHQKPSRDTNDRTETATSHSLVSTFHNNAFSPPSPLGNIEHEYAALETQRFHFRQAHFFLDGYFQTLHFIHPIIDRGPFLARCEDLWFGRADRQSRTFVALYYAVLSLGALVREWHGGAVDGLGRLEWSRKLFQHANAALGGLRATHDLETVQTLIILAKVCQNELNPHLAYIYLGIACRAALSAGHNRQTRRPAISKEDEDLAIATSKTWWGLYSLEVETSLALGRPDCLGPDEYHNRFMPAIDDSETAIISCMVNFARIVRKVSIFIYLSGSSVLDQTSKAALVDKEMDNWLLTLPEKIRPKTIDAPSSSINMMKDPEWARRQRLVLELRYLNVKMILYRPFLICWTRRRQQRGDALEVAVKKCVDAARKSIERVHETFCKHSYFRTWFYNTTYILYAASIILCYATRVASAVEQTELFQLIDMTIEVLEVMEESVVAVKAADMVRQILSQAREEAAKSSDTLRPAQQSTPSGHPPLPMNSDVIYDYGDAYMVPMPDLSMDPDLDFINASLPLELGQFPFWSDFDHAVHDFKFT